MSGQVVYSSQSTRWGCTCPEWWDVDVDDHDEDCPENPDGDDLE